MDRIYLDNAATTRLSEAVKMTMEPWLEEQFANPSSAHRPGVDAADAIDRARSQVAKAVGARSSGVIFTSGGTEADNLAVIGLARARRKEGRHVLLGPTEHAAVRMSALALTKEGFEVEFARLDRSGALDLADYESKLRSDTVLVAQMLVSNEFGSIYPIPRLAKLVRSRSPKAALHVDAVQGLGKLDLCIGELGADSIALSAHKVHGPMGNGALVLAGKVEIEPLFHGGSQEGGRRAGTENMPGIVGFGRAVELIEGTRTRAWARYERLRDKLCAGLLQVEGVRLIEPGPEAVPSILSILAPGVPSEVRLHHLDAHGLQASAGSACNAKKRDISPALVAAGLDEEAARRVMRFSFSSETTEEEIEAAVRIFREVSCELATH